MAATLDDKASLAIIMGVVFLDDTARGIFFPSLWAYIASMGSGNEVLGYCVGAFSLGRCAKGRWHLGCSEAGVLRARLSIRQTLAISGENFVRCVRPKPKFNTQVKRFALFRLIATRWGSGDGVCNALLRETPHSRREWLFQGSALLSGRHQLKFSLLAQ